MALINANRKSYDFGDIVLTLLGNQPVNVKAISYESSQETQLNYGRGNKPVGHGRGQISYTGSITLGMDEITQIEAVAPDGDITQIRPFDIIVSYINEDQGIVNDVITCFFNGNGRNPSNGDMDLSRELPLQILNIQFNKPLNTL
jgi:hypothetical protein